MNLGWVELTPTRCTRGYGLCPRGGWVNNMSKMIATAEEVSLDDCASYLLALANSYGRVLEGQGCMCRSFEESQELRSRHFGFDR